MIVVSQKVLIEWDTTTLLGSIMSYIKRIISSVMSCHDESSLDSDERATADDLLFAVTVAKRAMKRGRERKKEKGREGERRAERGLSIRLSHAAI